MSSQSAVADVEVEEPPIQAPPPKETPKNTKPKRLPPYAVVVLNDDEHSFEYVIETFIKVFGYAKEKCFQLASQIHTQGRTIVWTGPLEVAELKRDQVISAGPDFRAQKKVSFPLGVILEPLPQ